MPNTVIMSLSVLSSASSLRISKQLLLFLVLASFAACIPQVESVVQALCTNPTMPSRQYRGKLLLSRDEHIKNLLPMLSLRGGQASTTADTDAVCETEDGTTTGDETTTAKEAIVDALKEKNAAKALADAIR